MITCEEVRDYSDEGENTILIGSSNVQEQFNSVDKFPNLFPEYIVTKLFPVREVNYLLDPKPGLDILPICRTSAHKFS